MHLSASPSHTLGATAARTCSSTKPAIAQVARSPEGYSSVEAYDADRLRLDAQVCKLALHPPPTTTTTSTPACGYSRLRSVLAH